MHVISHVIALRVPPICEKIGVSEQTQTQTQTSGEHSFPQEARDAVNIERGKEIYINAVSKPLFIIFMK